MTDHVAADDPILIASVKLGEGLRFSAYPDPDSPLGKQLALALNHRCADWQNLSGAPWTLGYGHTSADVKKGSTCTRARADALLIQDLTNACAALDAREPWWRTVSIERQRVLVEMVFNLGITGLMGFHRALLDMQNGNYGAAADDLLQSLWAKQIGARAQRLAERMRIG